MRTAGRHAADGSGSNGGAIANYSVATVKSSTFTDNFAENMDTDLLNFDDESLDKKFMDKALKILKENFICHWEWDFVILLRVAEIRDL